MVLGGKQLPLPVVVEYITLVSGAQVSALAFCVYHIVVALGVYHSVLGTQVDTQ